jgi:hypothetical protein
MSAMLKTIKYVLLLAAVVLTVVVVQYISDGNVRNNLKCEHSHSREC